jgi:transketolase
MRRACFDALPELAARDERVVFIGSDLGAGTLDDFRNRWPERFFMEGVSEAHIIGMAAGLAMDGFKPYVSTIATFLTRRCLEQVAVDLCLHDLPVRLLGIGGGLVYAPLGPTHMAFEDFALLRSLPNMAIVAPADTAEMKRAMTASLDWPGPLYLRIAKGGEKTVTRGAFEIGRAYRLAEGRDALLITTGIGAQRALNAVITLKAIGIDAGVLHMPSVKPLDVPTLVDALAGVSVALTVEEHSVTGGLGSAVAEVVAESDLDVRFRRIGLPDAFPAGYGSQETLMARYGITAEKITEQVAALLRGEPRALAGAG